MKPTVYIETTIVSYLTARPARDVVTAGRQQVTRDWWAKAGQRYELVASQMVIDEAASGDTEAARKRPGSGSMCSGRSSCSTLQRVRQI